MNYVNFWTREIALALVATSCPLDLPDGEYRLTITDSATEPTAWEILDAVVVSGTAELTRAQEDTESQDWPAGSVIYCSITAGQLSALMGRIMQLEDEVIDLNERVAALEGGAVPEGALTDGAGNLLLDANGNHLTIGEP